MSYIFRCECCPGEPPPESSGQWRITRVGDVVTSWSCDEHLPRVMRSLMEGRPTNQALKVTRQGG